MKKLLSLSLASAMVLAASTTAFADISFTSTSSDRADWPNEFGFGGKIIVMNDKTHTATDLESANNLQVAPGDSIYMPLYHNVTAVVGESGPTIGESGEATTGVIPYKGNVDKNWKINFVEKSKRFIETAEFYKADSDDTNLLRNAVYVKLTAVEVLDSVNKEDFNFGVNVSEKGSQKKTKQVYVKGEFSNPISANPVDFEWTNTVEGPTVFEVGKNDDGTATFEFEDGVVYSVKMFGEEKVLLNLSRTHDKNLMTQYDTDLQFYNFNGSNDAFSAVGTLSIPSDEEVYVYEMKNGLKPVEYTYNENNEALEIKTRVLGNYVVSPIELDTTPFVEDSNANDTVEEETVEEITFTDGITTNFGNGSNSSSTGSNKPNPSTGANSMVNTAVALAVVSLVGGIALSKKSK